MFPFAIATLSLVSSTRLKPEPSLKHSAGIQWTHMTGVQMLSELTQYDISAPEWLSISDSYYFAKCDGLPAAFVSYSDKIRGRPIANICAMNRGTLERANRVRSVWRDFETEFGMVPIFDHKTTYFCSSK